jgi:hypothetical protein
VWIVVDEIKIWQNISSSADATITKWPFRESNIQVVNTQSRGQSSVKCRNGGRSRLLNGEEAAQ